MKISIIVAMAENGVIGRDGGLPWRIPEDLKRFKAITMGKPIIMGRKTFQSIGKPLPGRPNIVITRDVAFQAEGIHVVHGFDQALIKATELGTLEAIIIGGAEIYRLALPLASKIYVTEVHGSQEGDTHFPKFDRNQWQETSRECHPGQPAYDFVVLDKRGPHEE